MVTLISSFLKSRKPCFQLTILTTRNNISAFSLPFWLQGMIFLHSAYLFDHKRWYSFIQLTCLTTRDDIPSFSLPVWPQGMIFLLTADPLNNKMCMPCFQLISLFICPCTRNRLRIFPVVCRFIELILQK